MKIIGFSLHYINAEKKQEQAKEKIEVKSNIAVDDISKTEIDFSKDSALKIDFTFSVTYSPSMANIDLKGSIILIDENNESTNILRDWKKKEFDSPLKLQLFNFIMDKCNLKALELEEELTLPFHIPMPKFSAPSKETADKNNNAASYAG